MPKSLTRFWRSESTANELTHSKLPLVKSGAPLKYRQRQTFLMMDTFWAIISLHFSNWAAEPKRWTRWVQTLEEKKKEKKEDRIFSPERNERMGAVPKISYLD